MTVGKRRAYQRSIEEPTTDGAIEESESGADAGDGIDYLLVGDALVEIRKHLLHHTVAGIANDETAFFRFWL